MRGTSRGLLFSPVPRYQISEPSPENPIALAGVLLLVITSWQWIALIFPLWMLMISVCILMTEFHPKL
jgi:hypothetical protein